MFNFNKIFDKFKRDSGKAADNSSGALEAKPLEQDIFLPERFTQDQVDFISGVIIGEEEGSVRLPSSKELDEFQVGMLHSGLANADHPDGTLRFPPGRDLEALSNSLVGNFASEEEAKRVGSLVENDPEIGQVYTRLLDKVNPERKNTPEQLEIIRDKLNVLEDQDSPGSRGFLAGQNALSEGLPNFIDATNTEDADFADFDKLIKEVEKQQAYLEDVKSNAIDMEDVEYFNATKKLDERYGPAPTPPPKPAPAAAAPAPPAAAADKISINQERLRNVTKANNGKVPVGRTKAVGSFMAREGHKGPGFRKRRGLGLMRKGFNATGSDETPQQFAQGMEAIRAKNKEARQARRGQKSSSPAPATRPLDLGSPSRMPVRPEPGALGSGDLTAFEPETPAQIAAHRERLDAEYRASSQAPAPSTTPTPAAQAASSATTTTAGTATPAAPPSATPVAPSQAAAATASAAPTPSAAPAGTPPPTPPPPPSAGATPPPASPPPPPKPTVTTAKDAMKRGQRVQGPTGVRNRGSNIHNNSFWQRELHLSSQGLIGGLASVANDFGLNRRVESYVGKKASTYTDSFFGKSLSGSGYVHPVQEAGEVVWKSAKTLDAAERAWAQHISSTAQNSTGIMGALTKSRAFIHGTVLGGQGSMANKALTALGGAGSTIAPLMAAGFAINDARQGYREGGILGAASGAATGYLTGALVNKVISGVLLNPVAGLVGGGLLAATMYTTHKIFDVRNKGVEYLRMGRMQGLTWEKGPSPGMSGANIASMRQRSLNAMENSRFNAMKAIGNESYMMSAPKARYSNSTAINSIAPMLSY